MPGQWIPPDQLPSPGPPPPVPPPDYGALLPPPPPPRKSRTGLIIGLVLAGLAVLAGLLVVGLLVYADDDASDEDATSSTEPEAEPEPEPEVVPEGELMEGDGYSYVLPDGWQDITDEVVASDPGTTLDTGSAWGDSIATGRANMIVEVAGAGGITDLDDARNQLSSSLEAGLGVTPEPIDNRTIGGQEAAGMTISRTNELDVEILQTAYVTIRDDMAYVITTSNKSADDGPQDAYEAIYESWSWE